MNWAIQQNALSKSTLCNSSSALYSPDCRLFAFLYSFGRYIYIHTHFSFYLSISLQIILALRVACYTAVLLCIYIFFLFYTTRRVSPLLPSWLCFDSAHDVLIYTSSSSSKREPPLKEQFPRDYQGHSRVLLVHANLQRRVGIDAWM